MIRSLLTIIILIFLGVLSVWLYENPGAVQIVWLGYEVTSNMWVFTGFVLLLGLATSLLFWLLGRILSLPSLILGRYRNRKKAQGLAELESALIALTAENKTVTQKAIRASELLHADKLSHLGVFLQAEAALQAGDSKTARKHYQTLCNENEFAFLGYRGLCLTEKTAGNYPQAIEHALMAQKLDKQSLWAVRTLAELYEESKNYQNAIDVLTEAEAQKLWNKEALAGGIARLYLLLAKQARQAGNDIAAMQNAKAGHKKDNSVQELLPLLAILHARQGEYGEAEKTISPLLDSDLGQALATYAEILILQHPNKSQDAEIKRLSQAESYLAGQEATPEVAHFLADLCLKAQVWGKARGLLESIPADAHSVRHCHLMAQLEDCENGNTAASNQWLEKAETL